MQPTLHHGDQLLIRYGTTPHPGDLVVVRFPDRPVAVKRLVRREPGGGWWVERDSRVEGVDSWSLGAVPDGDLLGVVRARLWPRPRLFRSSARESGPGPA